MSINYPQLNTFISVINWKIKQKIERPTRCTRIIPVRTLLIRAICSTFCEQYTLKLLTTVRYYYGSQEFPVFEYSDFFTCKWPEFCKISHETCWVAYRYDDDHNGRNLRRYGRTTRQESSEHNLKRNYK